MSMESDWRGLVDSGLLASGLGALGRLLSLARSAKRPRGWQLLWEVPLAIGMGLIGISLASYFEVINTVSYGVIIGVAYLGPQIIDRLAETAFRKNKPTDNS